MQKETSWTSSTAWSTLWLRYGVRIQPTLTPRNRLPCTPETKVSETLPSIGFSSTFFFSLLVSHSQQQLAAADEDREGPPMSLSGQCERCGRSGARPILFWRRNLSTISRHGCRKYRTSMGTRPSSETWVPSPLAHVVPGTRSGPRQRWEKDGPWRSVEDPCRCCRMSGPHPPGTKAYDMCSRLTKMCASPVGGLLWCASCTRSAWRAPAYRLLRFCYWLTGQLLTASPASSSSQLQRTRLLHGPPKTISRE